MGWHTVTAAGRGGDLWVRVTGDGAPTYGRWVTPSGQDVRIVLGREGPPALDVRVWWVQEPEHAGKRLTDFLWQTGPLGLKLLSNRMLEILRAAGGRLESFDVDIRLRSGGPVTGYSGALEERLEPGPVHSLWRGRRSHDLVVSDEVRATLERAKLTGLEIESVEGPFPADRPGFLDEDSE